MGERRSFRSRGVVLLCTVLPMKTGKDGRLAVNVIGEETATMKINALVGGGVQNGIVWDVFLVLPLSVSQ